MAWFWRILILVSFAAIGKCSEGKNKHEKKDVPSAVVVGTVYCGTCFLQYSPKATIAGATVAVECNSGASAGPSFRCEVRTNKHGKFRVPLPLPISKHVKKIKGCSVKLISSNHPYCAVAATADSSSLHLKKMRKDGTHILSAGFFTFRPQLCDQKPNVDNSIKRLNGLSPISKPNDPSFPPPLQDPPPSDPPILGGGNLLPPLLPRLPPLPPLSRLSPLLGIPFLPPASQYSDKAKNQLENAAPLPTGIIPTIPLQPPPSAFPPVLPAVPGSTPPPIPVPPFPSQTAPSFPRVPPAEAYSTSRTSFP